METTCLNIHYNILPSNSNTFLKSKSALYVYTMVQHDQTPLACLLAGGGGGEHHTGGALLPELSTQPEAVSGQHHLHHQGRRVTILYYFRYLPLCRSRTWTGRWHTASTAPSHRTTSSSSQTAATSSPRWRSTSA